MLTIKNFKKLEGLVVKDGLTIDIISELSYAYSICFSDSTNIALDRNVVPNLSNRYPLYRMYNIDYKGKSMTEFVNIKTINTLDRMREQLIYIKEKYQ